MQKERRKGSASLLSQNLTISDGKLHFLAAEAQHFQQQGHTSAVECFSSRREVTHVTDVEVNVAEDEGQELCNCGFSLRMELVVYMNSGRASGYSPASTASAVGSTLRC